MHEEPHCDSLYKELDLIENQIYKLEKEYLEETSAFNNGLIDQNSNVKSKTYKHCKYPIAINSHFKAKDRLFSLSSCTSGANIELKREVEQSPYDCLGLNADYIFAKKKGSKAKLSYKEQKKPGNAIIGDSSSADKKDDKATKSVISNITDKDSKTNINIKKKKTRSKRISKGKGKRGSDF